MKQMTAPQAPVQEEIPFVGLAQGFFRRTTSSGSGEVFFGWNRAGAMYHFPVLEDGCVSMQGKQFIPEEETIFTLRQSDLGIKEIKFTDETPSD